MINTQARGLTYKIGLIVGGAWPVFHTPGLMGDGWGEPEQYFSLLSHPQAVVRVEKWELSQGKKVNMGMWSNFSSKKIIITQT